MSVEHLINGVWLEAHEFTATPPGGPWGGYPGRGAWRYPTVYDTATAERTDTPLNIQDHGRIALAVTGIQNALVGAQFACPVNGHYDIATYNAVVAFQQSRGSLVVGPFDGEVGPRTARALLRPYAQWWQGIYHVPDNLVVAQLSWESGGWDPGAEGQLDPRDRGLAQLNSTFKPDISDAQAFDPLFSTQFLAHQQASEADRLGALRPQNVTVSKWDLAVAFNKGPSAAEHWALTGVAPAGYPEYVANVRLRGVLELSIH